MTRPAGRKRHLPYSLLLGGITLIGLILRLIVSFQLYASDPAVRTPLSVTDMATYQRLAEEILRGTFPGEFYYQPFYYAVFLPAVQFLTGPSPLMVVTAQSLLGAAAVWLTGIASLRAGAGRYGSLSAALLIALSRTAMIYTPYYLLETLQSFWLILTLVLMFRAMRKYSGTAWFCAGLSLGCAVLTRGNALLFLPVLIAGIFLARRGAAIPKIRRTVMILLLLAGMLLPQLPFIWVNTAATGHLSWPSTAGSNVLALGNTPEAPPGGLAYPESYHVWTEGAKVRSVPRRMLDWFLEEPNGFLELQFRKVLQFWNHREIPNNISLERSIELSSLLRNLPLVPTGLILLVTLTAFLCALPGSFRGNMRKGMMLLYLLIFCLATAAFYNLARFRLTGLPLCCAAGGLLIPWFAQLRRTPKEKKRIPLLLLFFALTMANFLVFSGFSWYNRNAAPRFMRLFRRHGIDVPARDGRRLIYDHSSMLDGGWMQFQPDVLIKTFAPRHPVTPGTPIELNIPICGPGLFSVNGKTCDLRSVAEGRTVMTTIPLPWPEDGKFTIRNLSNTVFLMDVHRNYGRTRTEDGTSPGGELVIQLRAPGK